MKNRTLIGIICIILAVAIIFLITPAVSKVSGGTVIAVRLTKDIPQGNKITETDVETVKLSKDATPSGVFSDTKNIIGKYASVNLFKGDYLTINKIISASKAADNVFTSLNGQKFAMSFTIDSFAAGLSGKIKNGDIISLVVMDGSSGKAIMPPEFKYVRVITTTTSGGVDQDKVQKKEDGTFDPPATITLLVNNTQARLLAEFEASTINCILVYRGSDESAEQFIAKQDEYFASGGGAK